MVNMSRPPFRKCAVLAACTALTASACGRGLYTGKPLVEGADTGIFADAGTVADVPPADLPVIDAPIFPGLDASSDRRVSLDLVADVGSGSSITQGIDLVGGDVTLGIATFSVDRETFSQETLVTLTLVSEDGKGADHPGAIGPIYSLSKTAKTDAQEGSATLRKLATLIFAFTPADPSIPAERLTLAYLSTDSNPTLWIPISKPPPTNPPLPPGDLAGSVSEFPQGRWFAPVESCTAGQTCPDPLTCKSFACQ
jgi:hypothetical protein